MTGPIPPRIGRVACTGYPAREPQRPHRLHRAGALGCALQHLARSRPVQLRRHRHRRRPPVTGAGGRPPGRSQLRLSSPTAIRSSRPGRPWTTTPPSTGTPPPPSPNGRGSPSTARLPVLSNLSCRARRLSGRIPSEFGALTALRVLSLHGNFLRQGIPEELGQLTHLRTAGPRQRTAFTMRSRPHWATWPNLSAWISAAVIPAPPTTAASGFTSVVVICRGRPRPRWVPSRICVNWTSVLQRSVGSDASGAGTDRLTKLERGLPHLASTSSAGPSRPHLAALTSLRELDLSGNNDLSGPIRPRSDGLPASACCISRGTNLRGPLPAELGALTALRSLDLRQNEITGPIPAEWGGLIESAAAAPLTTTSSTWTRSRRTKRTDRDRLWELQPVYQPIDSAARSRRSGRP